MIAVMLQLHIVFVLVAAKAGSGTLTSTSDRLSAAVVGDQASFSCRIDDSTGNISWIFYRTESKKEHTIHTGKKMNPAFEAMFTVNANRSTGASELLARSVTSSESGMFLCSETHTAVTRVDFELVVLESTPKCQLDVSRQRRFPAPVDTDDQLRVNCSVSYSGNVVPSFRCDPQFRGEQVSDDADVSTHVVSYSKRVNASMVNATTHITCRAMLNSTMRDGQAAIKYFYNWNSTHLIGSSIYGSDAAKTSRSEARIDNLMVIVVTLVSVISLLFLAIVGGCVVVICRRRRAAAASAHVIYDDACTAASDAPLPDGMTHIRSSSVPPDVTTGSRKTPVGASDAHIHRAPSNGSSINSNVSEHNYSEIREVDCDTNSDPRVKSTSGSSTGIYMGLNGDEMDIQRQSAVPSIYAIISAAGTLPPRPPRIVGDSGQAVGLRAFDGRGYRSASGKAKCVQLSRAAVTDVH